MWWLFFYNFSSFTFWKNKIAREKRTRFWNDAFFAVATDGELKRLNWRRPILFHKYPNNQVHLIYCIYIYEQTARCQFHFFPAQCVYQRPAFIFFPETNTLFHMSLIWRKLSIFLMSSSSSTDFVCVPVKTFGKIKVFASRKCLSRQIRHWCVTDALSAPEKSLWRIVKRWSSFKGGVAAKRKPISRKELIIIIAKMAGISHCSSFYASRSASVFIGFATGKDTQYL